MRLVLKLAILMFVALACTSAPQPTQDIGAVTQTAIVEARLTPTVSSVTVEPTPSGGSEKQQVFLDRIAPLVQRVRPAVVRVNQAQGVGSGAIFMVEDDTAYILTNEHVIDGNEAVTVTVEDQHRYGADVLGKDARRDLAVLRVCCGQFTALPFADPSEIMAGLPVISMGYAIGLAGEATITVGIISAIREDRSADRWELQSDAAINPGNSGGPMISLDGELLGINTYIAPDTEGIGFAVSVRTITDHLLDLLSGTPSPRPTFTPTPRPIATPTIRPTNTPGPTPTPQPTPRPTATRTPTPSPTPTPTITPAPTQTPVPGMEGIPLFFSESKVMKQAWTQIHSLWQAKGNLRLEATFHNPYHGRRYHEHEYGLVFRDNYADHYFVFGILHQGYGGYGWWYLKIVDQQGSVIVQLTEPQYTGEINTDSDESNFLRVVVVDDQVVQLAINDTLVHDAYTAPYPKSEYYDISEWTDTGHVGQFTWRPIEGSNYLYIEDYAVYAEEIVWLHE